MKRRQERIDFFHAVEKAKRRDNAPLECVIINTIGDVVSVSEYGNATYHNQDGGPPMGRSAAKVVVPERLMHEKRRAQKLLLDASPELSFLGLILHRDGHSFIRVTGVDGLHSFNIDSSADIKLEEAWLLDAYGPGCAQHLLSALYDAGVLEKQNTAA